MCIFSLQDHSLALSCRYLKIVVSSCIVVYGKKVHLIFITLLCQKLNLDALLDFDLVECCLSSWLVLYTPSLQHFITYLTRQWRASSAWNEVTESLFPWFFMAVLAVCFHFCFGGIWMVAQLKQSHAIGDVTQNKLSWSSVLLNTVWVLWGFFFPSFLALNYYLIFSLSSEVKTTLAYFTYVYLL